MIHAHLRRTAALLLALAAGAGLLLAQAPPPPGPPAPPAQAADIETLKKSAVKVFISGDAEDLEYVKTEITFVNYVRDRKEADVHVLVTTQSTGSGGDEYTLTFMGQNGYADLQDIQKFYTEKTATEDEVRKGLVNALKLGLAAYVARTPIAGRVQVKYEEEAKPAAGPDPWDSWLFSVSMNGNFNGEKSFATTDLGATLSASRVTAQSKLRLGINTNREHNRYTYEGADILSDTDEANADAFYVKTLGEHWGVGGFASTGTSAYMNTRFEASVAPAVEYNVFPYSQSTRRQLRILYRLAFNPVRYREVTIYDKTRQNLVQQSLSATLELREKWGSVSTSLSGANYFLRSPSKSAFYQFNAFGYIQLNLYKGLNIFLLGGGSRIHDQLSLPKGELTLEEIILRRKQVATSYNYFSMIGLTFSFGSIYTNVVNPRFGTQAGNGVEVDIN